MVLPGIVPPEVPRRAQSGESDASPLCSPRRSLPGFKNAMRET
jgi:hypothetical protein